jgi:hypothetical protein
LFLDQITEGEEDSSKQNSAIKNVNTSSDSYQKNQTIFVVYIVERIVEVIDGPIDYTEWKAAYFNWIVLVQGRLSDLALYSMDHVEKYHVDDSTNEYFADCNDLKDSKKLQEHITK